MKRAIVTGSKGFVGKNLIEEIKNDFEILEINEDIFINEDWTNILLSKINKFSLGNKKNVKYRIYNLITFKK